MGELITYAENTWCPGCGNFGILKAFQEAVRRLEAEGIGREKLFISSGIGCHGKIADYLKLNGFYSIHGRSMATMEGAKIANPDLKVIAFVGDGDAMGEGIAHMIFAAKRNIDITVIMHDNRVYGLTTGQFTPTSVLGYKGPSTPKGSIEEPLNPLTMMLEAGATFVARGYSAKTDHLADIIAQAIMHDGFSFVDVLQPCVIFFNMYEHYNEVVTPLESVPADRDEAVRLARLEDRLPIGVFYKAEKPEYCRSLYGDWNPVAQRMPLEERRAAVTRLVTP